ncbi:MAG: protoporphyrinogen oxidase, partial [Aquificaceae bacterium]
MQVALVGAGISGLLVSYELKKLGIKPIIFEKEQDLSSQTQVFSISQELKTLSRELSLELLRLKNQTRCIIRDKKIRKFSLSFFSLLTSGVFKPSEMLSFLKEPFLKSSARDIESVADFILRRFNNKVLEYLVEPLISEFCLGDERSLSLKFAVRRVYELEKNKTGVIKGVLKNALKLPELGFFKDGDLIKELSKELSLSFENVVLRIRKKEGDFILEARDGKHKAKCVITCVPAWACAYMLRDLSWSASDRLEKLYYSPFVLVRANLNPEMGCFRILFPSSEGFRIKRAFLNLDSSYSIYLGGAKDKEALDLTDSEIESIVTSELSAIGFKVIDIKSIERHRRALPQFNLDYEEVLNMVKALEDENPGLFIG